MIRSLRRALALLALFMTFSAIAQPVPPVADRKPKDVSVHGDTRIDNYFWLRERDNPEVLSYLRAESAYSAAWFKPLDGFTQDLQKELIGRIQQADVGVPARDGRYWYERRTIEGGQYPVYVRRMAVGGNRHYDAHVPEQVLLDMNRMARSVKFLSLGSMSVSPDDRLLAYSTDNKGSLDFLLRVKDIASGDALPWQVEKVSSFEWAADSKTLFYVTTDDAKRSSRLYRYTLGQSGPAELVYEEKDDLFDIDVSHTQDHRFIVLDSRAKDTAELRVLPADAPRDDWRIVLPRKSGVEYSLEHRDGLFYLLIDDTGRNFRLVTTPAAHPSIDGATELVAARDDSMLEGMSMFRRHMVLQVRQNASITLRVHDFKRRSDQHIVFGEQVYNASAGDNREYDSDTFRLNYQSLTTPPTVYDYQLDRHSRTLRKVQPVLGGYDAKRYAARPVSATAVDGTRVPISLVYRRDLHQAGKPQPLLLYGYGSYGISMDPYFSASRLSLLDRGVVFAIAHIRGGGDLGRAWYDDGKLSHKMNTFTDFIASAETLVTQGYTSPDQLIVEGGSAGGLLMGASVNLRPNLFKAVVAEVPFVDVINTMLDESIPLTTGEFIEWGNPKIEEQYRWIRAYSPYDNLAPGAYPAMYVCTSLNDSQVPYWEPAKYVAKLRTLKTDDHPLLFDINMDAGHSGASGRFDALAERAKIYTFMLQEWGLVGPPKP